MGDDEERWLVERARRDPAAFGDRYDLSLDYRQPPPLPDLAPDEADWLDRRLRERGLR